MQHGLDHRTKRNGNSTCAEKNWIRLQCIAILLDILAAPWTISAKQSPYYRFVCLTMSNIESISLKYFNLFFVQNGEIIWIWRLKDEKLSVESLNAN